MKKKELEEEIKIRDKTIAVCVEVMKQQDKEILKLKKELKRLVINQ